MYGKKVKLRLLFLSFIFLIVSLSVFLILKSLEENVVYFISPTEIKNLSEIDNKKRIRVGGMVKEETVKLSQNEISFVITDFKNEINELLNKKKKQSKINRFNILVSYMNSLFVQKS